MPAKFKPSERVYDRNARGVRMNTHNPVKKMKHHYLKNQSKETHTKISESLFFILSARNSFAAFLLELFR